MFGLFALILLSSHAWADDRTLRLGIPEALAETGLPKYILPRFSLKTGVRVERLAPDADTDANFARDGENPVFSGPEGVWHFVLSKDDPAAQRFAEWLASDVGQNAVTGYRQGMFTLPEIDAVQVERAEMSGDALLGKELAEALCARCHVVNAEDRMNAIGSTPSFFVMRTLPDWQTRFEAFFALNPHPAFTQVAEVTEPFPHNRPPPIVPLEMTLEDLDAIIAYTSMLAPADLGKPLQHQ